MFSHLIRNQTNTPPPSPLINNNSSSNNSSYYYYQNTNNNSNNYINNTFPFINSSWPLLLLSSVNSTINNLTAQQSAIQNDSLISHYNYSDHSLIPSQPNSTNSLFNYYQNTTEHSHDLNQTTAEINQQAKTILSSESQGSFFSDQYCSVGTIGCSFITVVSVFHILFIFYVIFRSLPLWRVNFKQNKQKFFSIDPDSNEVRDIFAYGFKILLQLLGGIEALIQLILVLSFHEQGWMMIFEVSFLNCVCCLSTALFIYLDAITFNQTHRLTFLIIFINFLQNTIIFSILVATGSAPHVDTFCFICSSVYIATCISSTLYTHFKAKDYMIMDVDQMIADYEQSRQEQQSSSLLNSSTQHNTYNDQHISDQNLFQQQQTSLDYGYRSQNTSNNQIYQPPTTIYQTSQLPIGKSSKIEDDSFSRQNRSLNKQSGQQTSFFSSKVSNPPQNGQYVPPTQDKSNRSSNATNKRNSNVNSTSRNSNLNNNDRNSNANNSSNNLVKRSLSAQKLPTVLLPNTPEDSSFSSINNYQHSEDEEHHENLQNDNPNQSNNQISKKKLKKVDMNKYQQDRLQLVNRSKSSIQCIGRKEFNSNDNSLDRIEEEGRENKIGQGFFIGDKWCGSVDITDNGEQNQYKTMNSNVMNQNISGNLSNNNNNIGNNNNICTVNSNQLSSCLKQINNFQGGAPQQLQRLPTNQTDILHSSVEYGGSNQFTTPSFTNNPPQIDSQTFSSNRDSLYLSQQITTPSFNLINQNHNSSIINNASSLQSSSTSSSKKQPPHSSMFQQMQALVDQQQFGVNSIVLNQQPQAIKKNTYLNSPNFIEGGINQQSPPLHSYSPSLGPNSNSGDTSAFPCSSVNENSEMSNQKQDSYQTSDSYLMNGGAANVNPNQLNNQGNLLNPSQTGFQKKGHQPQAKSTSQTQQQYEADKKMISKQKTLNVITSPQGNSRSSPQSDLPSYKNPPPDKQQVLNQMNDLLFKNKSSSSNPNQQQQQQQTQQPPFQLERSIGKVSKNMMIEEQKRNQLQQGNQDNSFTKKGENSQINVNIFNSMNSQQQGGYMKQSNTPANKSSNDNLHKMSLPDDDLGYYKERYSELKVDSFKQSEKFEKRTVVFNITYFDSKGEIVSIQRSYREFNDLHKYLSVKFKNVKFSNFPKKQNKLQLSSHELTDRTNHFNSYLQSVVNLIKTEVSVLNHFLSKDTICFSSQTVLKQQSLSPTSLNDPNYNSFLSSNSSGSGSSSGNKQPFKKLNSLPNKPRSVPETIFEDANDCSNVLTDSNASQADNDGDYSTMSCNYQPTHKSSKSQNYPNNSYMHPTQNSGQTSQKSMNSTNQMKQSGKK